MKHKKSVEAQDIQTNNNTEDNPNGYYWNNIRQFCNELISHIGEFYMDDIFIRLINSYFLDDPDQNIIFGLERLKDDIDDTLLETASEHGESLDNLGDISRLRDDVHNTWFGRWIR